MTNISITSWNGNAINDGTNYQSFLRAAAYSAPPAEAQMARRTGAGPLFGAMVRPGTILLVDTYIYGASHAALRTQLRQWFDPYDETPHQLIATGDDGTTQ